MSETAYTSLSHVRIERLAKTSKTAKVALFLDEHYERLLSSILIGNNIVNIIASTVFTLLATRWFGENGPVLSTVIVTVAILIFGEVTPKAIAKSASTKTCLATAWPLIVLYYLFYGFAVFFEYFTKFILWAFHLNRGETTLTEDELKMLVEDIHEEGVIPQQEHDLIQKSIIFDDKTVKDIMMPWDKTVKAYNNESDFEIKEMFEINNYSRVPYLDSDDNKVLGLLLQKDFYEMLIEQNRSIQSIIIEPLFFNIDTPISEAFRTLQKEKIQLSIIIDDDNNPVGVVSIEDIIEELVGEIEDEHDAEDIEENEYYSSAMKNKRSRKKAK